MTATKDSAVDARTAAGSRPSRSRVLLFVAITIGLSSLIGLFVADRLAGVALRRQMNLVFPANTVVTHETSEFKYTAKINSLGFRDHDVAGKVANRRRVIVLGDSFVYGWGVESEQSWPKVLEAELNQSGQSAEVLDLGAPGAGPMEYAEVGHRAIPVLQPDLVIVGVLEGDDIMQERIKLDNPRPVVTPSLRRRVANAIAPNIVALLTGEARLTHGAVPESAMRGSYKGQVAKMIETMSPAQREHLQTIDRDAYRMWLAGDLNPYIVLSAMKTPSYFAFTLDPTRKEVKEAIDRMALDLHQIEEDAERVGATAIVVSEPYPAYVVGDSFVKKFGFDLSESAATTTAPDDVIETACREAHVKYASVTPLFRHAEHREQLYYQYDGHLTPAGHHLMADGVAQAVFHVRPPSE
jgi:lysophospholipase L1-like esterase